MDFFKGKKIFITGHTGFKGTWLTRIMLTAGATVIGYSLESPTSTNLYSMAGFGEYEKRGQLKSVIGDIRDLKKLSNIMLEECPDIVFHLAAQPIVRESYKSPVYTYEVNTMGTVNVMEAVRQCMMSEIKIGSVVIITTDKVYKNSEREFWGYREYEELDGFDPYSNSKSCAELVVHSYRNSFFKGEGECKWLVPISTARAGNVIGGGDFANDRIIPDAVRAIEYASQNGEMEAVLKVRNPYSTRPYQHVLEPLAVYLRIAQMQYLDDSYADFYNVGPDDCDCVTTGELVTLFCESWNSIIETARMPKLLWRTCGEYDAPHEAGFLKLDSTKIKVRLGYKPRWHIKQCIDKTADFTKIWLEDIQRIPDEMDREIAEYYSIIPKSI